MARPKKKGQAGNAKNFITRTQAVRKLQISLPDFRRLCIFKGIFPREPRNKKKAAKHSTPAATFYYARDIQYLLHEPLLEKFRQQKALAKKIGRLLGRNEVKDAARVEKQLAPRMTLDHIVKERYPTFVDALRDLDDCLCMLYLFANLPSTDAVPAKVIALCQRLVLEFEHYLIVSHSLRKSFLSIKGIYYQATIQGQDILWLVPYKFVQQTAGDIDFRIMGTFVEFYTTLLGFVNFRLYTTLGLVYPPRFDQSREDAGAELAAFTLEGPAVDKDTDMESSNAAAPVTKVLAGAATSAKAQKAADTISATAPDTNDEVDEDEEPSTTIDEFIPAAEGADVLPQPTHSSHAASTLFAPFVFYLSRETPRAPLEFLLRSFGCKRIGWDAVLGEGAWTPDEKDSRITHQIVDRPPVTAEVAGAEGGMKGRVSGRVYVQPQWVWDCVNAGKLLRPDHYAPGMTLPPHLSPWGRVKRGGYDPTKPLEPQDDDVEEDEQPAIAGEDEQGDSDDDEDLPEVSPEDADDALSDDEEEDEIALAPEAPGEDDFEGFSEEDEDDGAQMQRELEAEAKGLTLPSAKSDKKKAAEARKRNSEKARRDQAEELERQKMMLPRRKRKLLEKMIYSNAQTEGEADKLKAKRRRLEREQAAKAL